MGVTDKARLIIDCGAAIQDKNDPELWEVKSLTAIGVRYDVYFKGTGGRCTCKGFKYRGTCCHLEAVRILADVQKEEKVPEGEVLL